MDTVRLMKSSKTMFLKLECIGTSNLGHGGIQGSDLLSCLKYGQTIWNNNIKTLDNR